MTSTATTPALDRHKGSFSVDSSGLASYRLDLELPPGIGEGNTPQLSLAYAQGKGNGVTGLRWMLTSCSSVQRSPRNLALDGVNAPVTYNADGTRYALDGVPLILSSGAYGAPGAAYATEIDMGRTITSLGQDLTQGFVVADYEGRVLEYGTTDDSRSFSGDAKHIREWHLKYSYDFYGNCITYNYTESPRLLDGSRGTGDRGIKYLDGIAYNTNRRDGGQMLPSRHVDFFYSTRNDPVVVCGAGEVLLMAHRLSRVQTSVTIGSSSFQARAYVLQYEYSPLSGASRIVSITEEGADGSTLSPTIIEYSSSGDLTNWFEQLNYSIDLAGPQTSNVLSLLPMNITGKGLSDICLFAVDENRDLSAQIFLAQVDRVDTRGDSVISWNPSGSVDGTVSLPPIFKNSKPAFIPADLSGDGKTDLVMGFNSDYSLKFALSRCTGEGFAPYTVCDTPYEWHDGDSFFPMDCDGDGRVDIVQITTLEDEILIRSYYSSITPDGQHTLADITDFATGDSAANTLQWFPADVNGDNLQDLVRIWFEETDNGLCNVYVSAYISNAQATRRSFFSKGFTTRLGTYTPKALRRLKVLAFDINSDGIEDIVACEVDQSTGSDTQLTFKFDIFLCDGAGSFKLYNTQLLSHTIEGQTTPISDGKFDVMRLDGMGLPSLIYRFENQAGEQMALISTGNYSARISDFSHTKIFDQKARDTEAKASFIPADVNGSGKSSWIAWSSDGGPLASMIPVYNMQPLGDTLLRVTDPLGLCTTPTFRPISQSEVYKPGTVTSSSLPSSTTSGSVPKTMPILGGSQYVVSQYRETNVQNVNALSNSIVVSRYYEGAMTDIAGRGWQGFQHIYTIVNHDTSLKVETYSQKYPLTMYMVEEDVYTSSGNALTGFPDLTSLAKVRSSDTTYSVTSKSVTGGTTYMTLKVAEKVTLYDSGSIATINGSETIYDANGLPTQNIIFSEDFTKPSAPAFQQGSRTIYRSLGLRQNAVAMQKTSTVQSNLDNMTEFLSGDISWQSFTYDENTYGLTQKQEWSIYHNDYLVSSYQADKYGNQISYTAPSGLTETTTYDSVFNTFPVQVVKSGDGLAQPLAQSNAFDARFGVQITDSQYNGQVTFFTLDAFGRSIASKTNAAPVSQNQPLGTISPFMLALPDLLAKLNSPVWTTFAQVEYGTISDSQSNSSWMFKSTTNFSSQDSTISADTSTDYVDSQGRAGQTVLRHGSFPEVWVYRKFNAAGNVTAESIPIVPEGGSVIQNLSYAAPDTQCQTTSYDSLQRPVLRLGPVSTSSGKRLMSASTFHGGGTTVEIAQSVVGNGGAATDSQPLSTVVLVNKVVAGKTKVISKSELGKTTQFTYDAAGNMMSAIDPGLKEDVSNYNLQGLLLSINNQYQNPTGASSAAISYLYDVGLRPISETNASSETTLHAFDVLGRRTQRVGADGRRVIYKYDETPNGLGKLTSVSISKPNLSDAESSYSFTYDEGGRPISTSLSLDINGSRSYAVSYAYDLQGRMVSKTLPDGTVLELAYSGSQNTSTTMASSNSQSPNWRLKADYTAYDPHGKCVAWNISGSGSLSCNFSGSAAFDSLGGPISRSLSGASPGTALVQEQYITDDLGRVLRCEEMTSQTISNYTYLGQRLATSNTNAVTNTFNYDDSGNLLGKGGMQFVYSNGSVSGVKDNQEIFKVQYDNSGRMTSRLLSGRTFAFGYDSFGKTSSVTDQQSGQTSTFLSDFLGRSLAELKSDGTIKVQVSPDYAVTILSDGTQTTDRTLLGPDSALAKISTTQSPQGFQDALSVYYTNHKGNVSHIFDKANQLQRQLIYDDFGMLLSSPNNQEDLTTTYESQYTSLDTGLINFGARDYDPLLGRFTTPDDQWSSDVLTNCDVMNRYAFENNDPINRVDPTGHWTFFAAAAFILGVTVLIIAAATMASLYFGVAPALLMGNKALFGFLASSFFSIGSGAASYALQAQNQDASTFAKGIGTTIAVGFAFSLVTGALGDYVFTTARFASLAMRLGLGRAVVPAVGAAPIQLAQKIGSYLSIASRAAMILGTISIQHSVTNPAIKEWIGGDAPASTPPPPHHNRRRHGQSVSDGPTDPKKSTAPKPNKGSAATQSGSGTVVANLTSRASDAMNVTTAVLKTDF